MNSLCRHLILAILLLSSVWAGGQLPLGNTGSNLRQKKMAVTGDSLVLDTLSILPASFRITGLDSSAYRLDAVNAVLYWKQKPAADTVSLSYRVFAFKLNPSLQRLRYDSVVNNFYSTPFVFNSGTTGAGTMFDFGNITAQGSFGRQVSFGNNQDAVLNSTLNMQLNGMLGDSIMIAAAITDNNIPIQPDGSTQQLNEFDQVYLQFKKRNWQLNLGDIDIRQNQGYFLSFYKRMQGISFQTDQRLGKTGLSKTLVSGSVAKGKFTRNIIQGLEGNQGPYRLQGANNEFFFIILPNTERVFVDGEMLQRGEDQDYVINYNTAEITFTPRRMITKDSRIQVEFEYADRNFLNANLYLSQEVELNKKLKIRLGAFNNSDAKNSSINQVLSAEQKKFLATIGDSIQQALYPTPVLDTFAAGKVLYEKVIVTPGIDSFYRYSTDPALARYSISFLEVGTGRGNYIPEFNAANGKVYKYVAPISGVPQGNFEPVSLLVTPKKQQIFNLGMDYAVSKNTTLKTELAASNYDVNTFSSKDAGDDLGYAAKFQLNHAKKLNAKLDFTGALDYEYVQSRFKPLERLRMVEFGRDWGLPLQLTPADEMIIRASAGLRNKNNHAVNYNFTNYRRNDDYSGYKQTVLHNAGLKGWTFSNQFEVTNFSSTLAKGRFFRPVIDLNKQLKQLSNWRLGVRYALEDNQARNKTSDSLTIESFYFDSYSVYLKSDEKKKNKYGISFFTRSDKYALGKEMVRGDRSLNLNLQTELISNPRHQFFLNATFRKLKVYNPGVSRQKEDESILSRAEYLINEWKGLLTGNVLYEVGAGQEQKRDFAYLEVPAGQGQYAWIDYNNNGVQELNEFELALFPDQARFIRLFTPSNQFIKANYNTFNYSFNVNPRAVLSNPSQKGMKKFLAKLNLQTSLQVSKKTIAKGLFEFNPFKYDLNDTALITLNTVIANTLSFNRYHAKWGMDLTNLRNSGKALLTYGYESRNLNDWIFKVRWNITRKFTFDVNTRKGKNLLSTSNAKFDNRNYNLSIRQAEPRITLIKGTTLRLATSYKYDNRQNKDTSGEKSVSHSLNLETKYNVLRSVSVEGKFTFTSITYNKTAANTTVGYIMLDGLLPGKNYLWNARITKTLLNNLELRFEYEGRKPGTGRTIHTGRAAISALF